VGLTLRLPASRAGKRARVRYLVLASPKVVQLVRPSFVHSDE
jgi:hypothetical protein